jgi:hypothetical protein
MSKIARIAEISKALAQISTNFLADCTIPNMQFQARNKNYSRRHWV